jgi:uncharacterized lipoprotein YbaY
VALLLERVGDGPWPLASGTVTGTVAYRAQMPLPKGAELRIAIVDTADGKVVSDRKIKPPGRSPVRFELDYKGDKVDRRRDYAVQARIESGRDLLYQTVGRSLVITKGRPNRASINLEWVGGGGGAEAVPPGPLKGRAHYRALRPLPKGSELRIEIVDAASSRTVETKKIKNPGDGPVAFEVKYNNKKLDPRRDYVVRARITDGDAILFRTTGAVPVITRGNPTRVDIRLERTGRPGRPGGPPGGGR